MKNMLSVLLASIFIVGCGTSKQESSEDSTQTTSASKATNILNLASNYATSITSDELKEMLYIYASDEFEGRETGEPGQKKAVEYLKNFYQDQNIASPLGENNYFQEVPLQKLMLPTINMDIQGEEFKDLDDIISLRGSNSKLITTDEVIYAGYGIDDEAYNDYKNLDVKDKVVLIKAGEPKNEDGTFITTGGTEETKWSSGRQARSSKRNAAVDRGAKALIMLEDSEQFERIGAYYKRLKERGGSGNISLMSGDDNFIQLAVSEKAAKAIYPEILTDDEPKKLERLLSIDYKSDTEKVDSENVVAFIKGSEKPDEIIVISAHLDHEGMRDGQIYNGADDDGSGTIAILEIAEAFKKAVEDGHGPKRSILFLHVTGEERGLLGSRHYTDNDPIFPLENTIANLNIDMIGRIDPKRTGNRNYIYLIGSDKLSTELHELSEKVNSKYMNIELDYTYNDEKDPNRFYYRSDHYNFAKNNVPIIFYFNGTHDDYHKPTDTPDKIEYDLLENRTRLVFYTAWQLANKEKRIIADKADMTK